MSTLKLDEWDLAVIYYLKQDRRPTIDGVKEIWAQRNAVEPDNINNFDLLVCFSGIIENLYKNTGLYSYSLTAIIIEAAPNKEWQYKHYYEDRQPGEHGEYFETNLYYNRVLSVIFSILRHTEVKYLPGFEEYYDKKKNEISKI